MEVLSLPAVERVSGCVRLPGSKSIANRALLLSALSRGTTRLQNLPAGEDVQRMQDALRALGVRLHTEGDALRVEGCGGSFPAQAAELFLGNAGTAMRFLCAAVCLGQGRFSLDGVARMRERPIGPLLQALSALGAQLRCLGNPGFPPLEVQAQGLRGGVVELRAEASSQFLSALLLAAAEAQQAVRVHVQGRLVSRPYVEMTMALMARFGVRVEELEPQVFQVQTKSGYRSPGSFWVEGDASSASYFLAAAAVSGGRVRVEGCGSESLQGDARFANFLEQMGARVAWGAHWIEVEGPRRGSTSLRSLDADCLEQPDAAMTLAVAALFAQGSTTLRGISTWQVKETDRLAAVSAELQKLGAHTEASADSLVIVPPKALRPARISTYGDHRMAMAFSIASCGGVPVEIEHPGCVGKTFPDFFTHWARLSEYNPPNPGGHRAVASERE